jgi:hypothetical protein
MNRGSVGEERGGQETDGCPLTIPKADDFPEVDSPIVDDFLHPHLLIPQQHQTSLGCIGTVRMMLRHPPPSCGQPYMGGLVLGGLVLHSFVYYDRLT